jgi:hypothetical protein
MNQKIGYEESFTNWWKLWNVMQFLSCPFAFSWRFWMWHEQNWYIWFRILCKYFHPCTYVFNFSSICADYNMMYYNPVRKHPVISGYTPAELYYVSVDTSLTEPGVLQSNQMVTCLVLTISRLESWLKITPRKWKWWLCHELAHVQTRNFQRVSEPTQVG